MLQHLPEPAKCSRNPLKAFKFPSTVSNLVQNKPFKSSKVFTKAQSFHSQNCLEPGSGTPENLLELFTFRTPEPFQLSSPKFPKTSGTFLSLSEQSRTFAVYYMVHNEQLGL